MSATKTAPRPKPVLDQLAEVEQDWRKEKTKADERGRGHHRDGLRARELIERRNHIIHREPSLADHKGSPSQEGNDVDLIDKEIAKLGDLADSEAEMQHARRLADREKERLDVFVVERFEAIVDALKSDGADRAASVRAQVQALSEEADRYLGFHQRIAGLVATVRGDTSGIPGLDSIAELKRQLRPWQSELPNPAELRR